MFPATWPMRGAFHNIFTLVQFPDEVEFWTIFWNEMVEYKHQMLVKACFESTVKLEFHCYAYYAL